jgi:signal peptidase II
LSNKPNALVWLWLSAAVIVLDQLSKLWAVRALQPMGLPHPVIPGFLNWTLAFNTGAAFSFLADGAGWQRWFFVLLALVISVVLVVWLARTPRRDWRTGDAAGSDRWWRARQSHRPSARSAGHRFHPGVFPPVELPGVQLADCGITVGAVMLVAFGLFAGKSAGGVR